MIQEKLVDDTVTWGDPLWTAEYERGKEYTFKITYIDDHVEYGQLKYRGPITRRIPGGECVTIPEFESVAPHVSTGEVRKLEWVVR